LYALYCKNCMLFRLKVSFSPDVMRASYSSQYVQ